MSEPRGNWLWNLLRKSSRKDLDRIERDLVKRVGEKRKVAGDPSLPEHLRVPTRNK